MCQATVLDMTAVGRAGRMRSVTPMSTTPAPLSWSGVTARRMARHALTEPASDLLLAIDSTDAELARFRLSTRRWQPTRLAGRNH